MALQDSPHKGKGFKELRKQGIIPGDHNFKQSKCEDYIIGKHKRLFYNSSTIVSHNILDYIHAHLWGPFSTETIGDARYFLNISDHFSRKPWLYVLKNKDQALSKFKEWCVEVEISTGQKVKCLRTNNGL